MKRILALVAGVAVVLALGVGLFFLADADGPAAATVGDRTVSQQSINEELEALVENEELGKAIDAQQQQAQQAGQEVAKFSNGPGTITALNGSGWLSLVVSQTAAAEVVERRDLETTSADRTRGRELANQSLGGKAVFSSMPSWFQDRVADRWTAVAVLERDASEHPSAEVKQQLAAQCESGRYVAHILVATEAEALALKQQLDAGADFAELAAESSTDTGSAPGGGALGCADGQSFVEPFATVAATQPVGVVSDPVTTEFGSHLILVTDEVPAAALESIVLSAALSHNQGKFVDVSCRYGRWDRANGTVVPPEVPGTTSLPAQPGQPPAAEVATTCS